MEPELADDVESCSISHLPFMTLKYPEGNFPGSRTKCSFILIPPDEREMETMILHSGGQVLTENLNESELDYAVTILCERFYLNYPECDFVLPLDTFSSVYIHEAIENSRNNLPLPSLNSYRITLSKFHAYKPEDILFKHKKWSDLLPLPKPVKRRRVTAQAFVQQLKDVWKGPEVKPTSNTPHCSLDELNRVNQIQLPVKNVTIPYDTAKAKAKVRNSKPYRSTGKPSSAEDISFDDSEVKYKISAAANRKKRKQTSSRLFSQEEGQKLLDLICEKKAFMYTKGVKLFQLLELSQHFPGRSYQSLREHWRKKVHPNAVKYRIYDITPMDLDLLLNAVESTKWKKHSNICPDITF